MSELTFDKALEEIKGFGETEKNTIEIANELARIIGELTEARISCGLTQRQLAQKSGIKQSAIARMESLQAIPRLDTMIKIARCLDVYICLSSSSVRVVSIDLSFDLHDYMVKSNEYNWHSTFFKNLSMSFTGKEVAHAAIG